MVDLLGAGSEDDPVRGVVLDDGRRIRARWVFGADGRASTVARTLGLAKERPLRGEMSMAYAYWRGIPNDGYGSFQMEVGRVLTSVPVEDGLHMLISAGPPEMVRGTKAERRREYLKFVRGFPETLSAEVLDRAELVTDVAFAPESLMRGFFRRPAGPGWALVGDACHFKHPGTAQGIGDAFEQAIYLADAVSGPDPEPRRLTSAGAMPAPPSTTSIRSPGGASPGPSTSPSSAAGPPTPRSARTCATVSAAWSSHRP